MCLLTTSTYDLFPLHIRTTRMIGLGFFRHFVCNTWENHQNKVALGNFTTRCWNYPHIAVMSKKKVNRAGARTKTPIQTWCVDIPPVFLFCSLKYLQWPVTAAVFVLLLRRSFLVKHQLSTQLNSCLLLYMWAIMDRNSCTAAKSIRGGGDKSVHVEPTLACNDGLEHRSRRGLAYVPAKPFYRVRHSDKSLEAHTTLRSIQPLEIRRSASRALVA